MFFALTGAAQTFRYHKSGSNYEPPRILEQLSKIHRVQKFPHGQERVQSSVVFRYYVLAMSLGLAATVVMGVGMAFTASQRKWVVWAYLVVGLLMPLFLLYLGGGI